MNIPNPKRIKYVLLLPFKSKILFIFSFKSTQIYYFFSKYFLSFIIAMIDKYANNNIPLSDINLVSKKLGGITIIPQVIMCVIKSVCFSKKSFKSIHF